MTIPFLGGLARAAGAAAPHAANTLAAKNVAAAQGLQQQREQQLQMLMLAMQQRKQATADALAQAQTSHYNAETKSLLGKRNIMRGPGGQLVDATDPNNPVNIGPAPATKPDPVATHQANRLFDVKHPLPQQPTNVYMPGVGQGGQPEIYVGNNRGAPNLRPTGVERPAAGGSSPLNVLNMARVSSGVSQMENADTFMKQFEDKLRTHQASIDGLDEFAKHAASAFSHDNALGNVQISAALYVLNGKNPELARYVRRGLEFAQGESQVTQRPSDYRTKLSDFLATASTGATPDMLDDIANTRQVIYTPMKAEIESYRQQHPMRQAPQGSQSSPSSTPQGHAPNGAQTGNIDLREPNESHTAPTGAPKAATTGFDPEKFYRDYTSKKRSP